MHWPVYTEYEILESGIELEFCQFPTEVSPAQKPKADDTFYLEFPNNSRVGGKIISVNNSDIEVEIDDISWQLELSQEFVSGSNGKLSNYYKIKESN